MNKAIKTESPWVRRCLRPDWAYRLRDRVRMGREKRESMYWEELAYVNEVLRNDSQVRYFELRGLGNIEDPAL